MAFQQWIAALSWRCHRSGMELIALSTVMHPPKMNDSSSARETGRGLPSSQTRSSKREGWKFIGPSAYKGAEMKMNDTTLCLCCTHEIEPSLVVSGRPTRSLYNVQCTLSCTPFKTVHLLSRSIPFHSFCFNLVRIADGIRYFPFHSIPFHSFCFNLIRIGDCIT